MTEQRYEKIGGKMRILYSEDYYNMSRQAANIVSAQIIAKPNSVLGLPTGTSPMGMYKQLIEWYKKGDLSFAKVKTLNLDEYKGFNKNHPNSYFRFMYDNLFKHVNIDLNNVHIPNGLNESIINECEKYNKIIELLGGIDLQILGIGHNGHIGFNEPGESLEKGTHCIKLSQSTKEANKRFFNNIDEMPNYAYTVGIKAILQAKKILMVVNGGDKKHILLDAFFGPITPAIPASILQLHANLVICGDKSSLEMIIDKFPLSVER